jgi:hypothetical protein
MKLKGLHAVVVSAAILVSAFGWPSCTPSYNLQNEWACHRIQPGDTMDSVASQYRTSPDMVCDWNVRSLKMLPGKEYLCDCLVPGEWLRVPPTCVPEPGIWTCEPGAPETFYQRRLGEHAQQRILVSYAGALTRRLCVVVVQI